MNKISTRGGVPDDITYELWQELIEAERQCGEAERNKRCVLRKIRAYQLQEMDKIQGKLFDGEAS